VGLDLNAIIQFSLVGERQVSSPFTAQISSYSIFSVAASNVLIPYAEQLGCLSSAHKRISLLGASHVSSTDKAL